MGNFMVTPHFRGIFGQAREFLAGIKIFFCSEPWSFRWRINPKDIF